MCLDAVVETFNGKNKTVRVGYKVFLNHDGVLSNRFRRTKMLPEIGAWMKATTVGRADYVRGFHIFEKRRDAEYFSRIFGGELVSVKYRGILARGLEMWGDFMAVVVANEMYIPKNWNKERK